MGAARNGSALATLPEGSERGLKRFADGEVVAAIHLHVLERDDPTRTSRRCGIIRRRASRCSLPSRAARQGLVVMPDKRSRLRPSAT
ncbi:MAG: hypothetical protein R3D62_00690 [Xanthobacteraceae bacterium]